MIAANKVGKTYVALAESIQISLGIHPFHNMRQQNKGRIIGTDLEKGIEEDIWGVYKTLCPMSELSGEPKHYNGGQVKKITYKNGASVEFMSYEQDITQFEGGKGDWVLFNEPPPREIFVACVRWVMFNDGIIFIAATPLWEAWLYDELFLKQGPAADQPDVFQLSAYENPHLSDDAIKDLLSNTPEDEKEARIFGAFKHLTGLVYKEFGALHRIKSFVIPRDWTRLMVMDYHPRVACAILWAVVDPKGFLYFYNELKIDKSPLEIAEMIKLMEKEEYGFPVKTRWIDSIAATQDRQVRSGSATNEFRKCGATLNWKLYFRSSTKNRELGFRTCHEYLKLKNGIPGCYFFEENVPNLIASLMHYQYDAKDSIHAHFADCFRYICVTRPQWKPPMPQGYIEKEEDEERLFSEE
jgi:phage terminase large subunit-like protein